MVMMIIIIIIIIIISNTRNDRTTDMFYDNMDYVYTTCVNVPVE